MNDDTDRRTTLIAAIPVLVALGGSAAGRLPAAPTGEILRLAKGSP